MNLTFLTASNAMLTQNTKIAVHPGDGHQNIKFLCLTLTLVNVKNNVNKNSFRPNNFYLHWF